MTFEFNRHDYIYLNSRVVSTNSSAVFGCRHRMAQCLQPLVGGLAGLTTHPNLDIAATVIQILESVNLTEASLAVISQLCHSSVNLLLRALASRGSVTR